MNTSTKILFNNKEYYMNIESFEDSTLTKIFLYEDEELKNTAYNIFGMPILINKKDIDINIDESAIGGAGYAIYGGGGGNYGNPSVGGKFFGRGSGFGQSSSSNGGPNLMYTYSIKPLNTLLQQPGTPQGNKRYIYIGCDVKGRILGTDKKVVGKVVKIKESPERDVLYYLISDINNVQHKLDPTSITLIHKENNPEQTIRDITSNESFYPSFKNFLEKNKD